MLEKNKDLIADSDTKEKEYVELLQKNQMNEEACKAL